MEGNYNYMAEKHQRRGSVELEEYNVDDDLKNIDELNRDDNRHGGHAKKKKKRRKRHHDEATPSEANNEMNEVRADLNSN